MAEASRARAPVVGVVLFALITVIALVVAKWWPYSERTAALVGDRQWPGKSLLGGESGPSLRAGWEFLIAYSKSVWLALVAAVLIGAAMEALVPRERLRRAFDRRGTLGAAAVALPSFIGRSSQAPSDHGAR